MLQVCIYHYNEVCKIAWYYSHNSKLMVLIMIVSTFQYMHYMHYHL